MIKYNNSNINDWNFDDSNIVKVYHNNAVCYYKVTSEEPPQPTTAITYTATEKLNVYLSDFTPTATAHTFADGVGKIEFAESVTEIGDAAFVGITSLKSVEIPDSVTSLGAFAFWGCRSLTSITCEATTPPTLGENAFDGSTCPIYVPSASVNAYKTASGWSTYASRIQAIP